MTAHLGAVSVTVSATLLWGTSPCHMGVSGYDHDWVTGWLWVYLWVSLCS